MPLGLMRFCLLVLDFAVAFASVSSRVYHFPIIKTATHRTHEVQRRAGVETAIGLGDWIDVSYSVLLDIGPVQTPLVLDSGSSDLWVISDACTANCSSGIQGGGPVFPHAALAPTGLDVQLFYGDSSTETHAFGPIGATRTGIAALELDAQMFVAVNNTDTTIRQTGAIGIFGLGFPFASAIFAQVYKARFAACTSCRRRARPGAIGRRASVHWRELFAGVSRALSDGSLPTLLAQAAPMLPRAIGAGMLAQPLVAVTLQRNTVDPGGNEGLLSVGGLPSSVEVSSLTWTPVRLYDQSQGVLPPILDANDKFPLAWEILIDNVYLDGQVLPHTNTTPSTISITALIDTGNTLIRGPADMIGLITRMITSPGLPASATPFPTYDCSPHTLAFGIGGQIFPVDPRDLVTQASEDSIGTNAACTLNLAATDPPHVGSGYLYSWSLGIPFLKGVLAAFYYGNITNPGADPPRMGFLSTVQGNAGSLLGSAVAKAAGNGHDFPAIVQTAPPTTYEVSSTGAAGVPLAPTSIFTYGNAAARGARVPAVWSSVILGMLLSCALLRL